jgi:hypothetical protein
MERWLDIPGFEGRYQVSDHGNVRNTLRLLKPFEHRDGYLQVKLCENGTEKTCFVHRLVAVAFLPNVAGLPEVDHLDANKKHNDSTNLEWVSRIENMRRAAVNGLMGGKPVNVGSNNGQAKLTTFAVVEIRARVMAGEKQITLAVEYGVSRRAIGMIVTRERWAHV